VDSAAIPHLPLRLLRRNRRQQPAVRVARGAEAAVLAAPVALQSVH
jgi:hypothetical protein